ncbi:cobaltochelatase subunit CobN [Paucibacter sp. O1-1]|nr:cobaltochelatase subunit CobN [Paucibacter sp. O1-1]MDA3825985.1 cobaltochelatase subunit CobN [Paucibacter sp. O1-1]
MRDLKEATLRVFRSRVVNPKWIQSIKKLTPVKVDSN